MQIGQMPNNRVARKRKSDDRFRVNAQLLSAASLSDASSKMNTLCVETKDMHIIVLSFLSSSHI